MLFASASTEGQLTYANTRTLSLEALNFRQPRSKQFGLTTDGSELDWRTEWDCARLALPLRFANSAH